MKTIEIHGRKVSVPEHAKFVFQCSNGLCYWSVNPPEEGRVDWDFPDGDFGLIKFPMLLKGV